MQIHKDKPVVDIRDLTLAYGTTTVVSDFSLSVYKGEIHAIAGENGAGKTSLLKAIGGLLSPISGNIVTTRTVTDAEPRIAFVLQHDVLPPNMTLADCIQCAAVAARQPLLSNTIEQCVNRVGLSVRPTTRVSSLTMHQRQLLQLACALASKPSVLLLDEPTAVMSQPDSIHFWKLVKEESAIGTTIIVATHKLEDITTYCSDVTVMRTGRHVFTRGTSDVALRDIITGMAPETITKVHTTNRDEKRIGVNPVITISATGGSLIVHANEIHGIAGLDGSGYECWLNAVALNSQEGFYVTINGNEINRHSVGQRRALGITYIPPDRHADAIIGAETLETNMSYGAFPLSLSKILTPVNRKRQVAAAEAIVSKYDVRPPKVTMTMNAFSGGNQQKFVVGRELDRMNHIMVVNQPTRGLDRSASAGIAEKIRTTALRDETSILVYSDDLSFLMSVCDTISIIAEGKLTQTRPVQDWNEAMLVEAMV